MSMETWKPRRFVEEFQKRAGLLIDGKPGPQTQMALEFVPELPPGRIYPAVPELPEHLRTTPTPIDPADIRPGDVVRGRREVEVTVQRVEPGVIIDQDGDGWRPSVWDFCLVHRPDPDAEAVEALERLTWHPLVEEDSGARKRAAQQTLAALREQGWDVVRRAES